MTTPTTSSSSSSQRKPSPVDLSLSTDQTVTGRTRSKSSGGPTSPTIQPPPTSPHKTKGLLSMLNLGAGRRTASSPNMTAPSSPVPSLSSSPVPTLSSSASSPSLSTMSGTAQKIKRKPVPPLPNSAQVNIAAAGNTLSPLQTTPSSSVSFASPRSPTRPLPSVPSIASPILSSGQNLEVPKTLMPVKSISSSSKRSSIYSLKSTSSPNLGELSPRRHPARRKADDSEDEDEYEYVDINGRVSSELGADLSGRMRVNIGLNDIDWDAKDKNEATLGTKKKGALRGFGTFLKHLARPVDGENAHHTSPTPPLSSNSPSSLFQLPERSSDTIINTSRPLEASSISTSSTNSGPLYINTIDRRITDTKPILSPPTGDEEKDLKRTLNDYATVYATMLVEKEIKRRSFRISQAFEQDQMDMLAASLTAGDGSALGQASEVTGEASDPLDAISKDHKREEKKYEDEYITKRHSNKRESFQSHLDYFGLSDFEFIAGEDPLKNLVSRERSTSPAKPPQRPARSPHRPPSGPITLPEKRQEPNNTRSEPPQESGENESKSPPPRTSSLPSAESLHKRDSAPALSMASGGSTTPMSPTSPTSPPRASVLSRSGSLSTASGRTSVSKNNSKGTPVGQVGSYAAIMESWEEEVSNSTAKNRRYLARKPVPSSLPVQSTRQRPPSSPPVTRDQIEEKDKSKEPAPITALTGTVPVFQSQHTSSPVRERPTSPPPPTRPLPDPFENLENEASAREYRPSFASFQSKTASSIYSSTYETASDRASVDGFYEVLSASSSAIDFTPAMPPEILVDGDIMRNDYVNQNRDQMYIDDDEDGDEIIEDGDDEEDDEDVFVDADGYSQEELERMKSRRISKTVRKISIRRADSRRAAADKLAGVGSISAVTTSIVSARPLVPVLETLLPEPPEISLNATDQKEEHSDITVTMAQAPETEEVDFDEEAKLKAQQCWEEDPNFIEKEKLSEWLGTNKLINEKALYYYMAKFDFTGLRLDRAFRKLCAKLYFKAESQQIDRILRSFSQQYWDNNPTSLFGSADVIHSIVYSLLLLNTDLHVAQGQGGHTKMTKGAFLKNTMAVILNSISLPSEAYDELESKGKASSIRSFGSGRSWKGFGSNKEKGGYRKWWEGEVEKAMKEMYMDIKNSQILQPLGSMPPPVKNPRPISSMLGLSPSATLSTGTGAKLSRSSSFLDKGRSRPKERSVDDLPGDYSRMATLPVNSGAGSSRPTTPTSERSNRRDSFSSTLSGVSNMSATNAHSSRSHNASVPRSSSSIYASAPPYYKEGLLVRKHLLERADQKAKRRDWMECFISVDRGELKMYKLDGGNDRSRRVSMLPRGGPSLVNLTESFANGGNLGVTGNPSLMASLGNGWLSNAQPLGDIPLSHTFANALPPPGYNKSRPHVFALQLPEGGVYLFQANSQEQVNEWVFTCNYWAARESKEPLSGGVSNMEYGWGFCLESDESGHMRDPDSVMIFEWKPPMAPMVPSNLDEVSQLRILRKHTEDITKEADQLRDIRSKMVEMFAPRSLNHQKVIANWENYSQYLLQEIIKYTNYCDAIEQSIALQDKLSKDVDTHSDIGLTSVIEEEATINSRRTSFDSNGRGKRYSLDGGTGSRPSSTGTTDTMKRAPVKRN